ncbi:transposase [Bifidobacterium longum]|uniref:transposase n=1 Tax=Bifidobacterium longum TaxID=216816 RepID=UPI0030DCA09F
MAASPRSSSFPKKIRRRRPDIPRTIEPGCSNARLEAFDNRIKATIRMAYGFHRVTTHNLTHKNSRSLSSIQLFVRTPTRF